MKHFFARLFGRYRITVFEYWAIPQHEGDKHPTAADPREDDGYWQKENYYFFTSEELSNFIQSWYTKHDIYVVRPRW